MQPANIWILSGYGQYPLVVKYFNYLPYLFIMLNTLTISPTYFITHCDILIIKLIKSTLSLGFDLYLWCICVCVCAYHYA